MNWEYTISHVSVIVELMLGNRIRDYLWRYMGSLFDYDSYPDPDIRFIGG